MHECLSVHDWIEALADPRAPGARSRFDEGSRVHPGTVLEGDLSHSGPDLDVLDDTAVLSCSRCMGTFDALHDRLEELEHFDPTVILEHESAEAVLESLLALPPDERSARITQRFDDRGWGLTQALLASSRALWVVDPEAARQRARAAVVTANGLDPMRYHPQWTGDLRAKAHAYLGNTHRIRGDFAEAERAFQVAGHHLRLGVGGGRARSQVFSLEASLLIDQQRLVEAQALLDSVLVYYRKADDRRAIARTHLKRAIVATDLGEREQAIEELSRARGELDPARDARLYVLTLQNRVAVLLDGGNVDDARRTFDELPPSQNRWMELRRLWIEGNLFRAEKAHRAAHLALEAARNGFAEDGNLYYAGLVSLDQTALALDRGDPAEALRTANEASLLLVRSAARAEALTAFILRCRAVEKLATRRRVSEPG